MLRRLSTLAPSVRRAGVAICGTAGTAAGLAYCSRSATLCEASPGMEHKKLVVAPSAAEALKAPTMQQRLVAEVIGTGIIVQLGCGVVCAAKYAPGANFTVFGLAATWGVAVALAVYATRAVSGAHLNPAVTGALVSIGAFPSEEAPLYVAAQILGATISGAANYLFFSAGIAATETAGGIVRGAAGSASSFAGAFGMVPNAALLGPMGAFAAEVWMTSILVFIIWL